MVRLILLALLLATTATAGPSSDVDWLTTFEVAPGGTVAMWTLVDSHAVWPSAFDDQKDYLKLFRHMYEHKGDYLAMVVYLDGETKWRVTDDTRIAFAYEDRVCVATEVIFPAYNADGETVLSSRIGVVVGSTPAMGRSSDDGYYAYLRFAPGSLPRPARRWWFWGGNRWGVVPPHHVVVQVGG